MSAATLTPYGRVSAAWTAKENVLRTLDVEIPFNTTAKVYVPAESVEAVACDDASVKAVGIADGYVEFQVGSGRYCFTVK